MINIQPFEVWFCIQLLTEKNDFIIFIQLFEEKIILLAISSCLTYVFTPSCSQKRWFYNLHPAVRRKYDFIFNIQPFEEDYFMIFIQLFTEKMIL